MARIDNLTNFLTDVADSIRSKTGKSETIAAEDFDTEIESIETGGTLQSKSITITENGTTSIIPDAGYDGLSDVSVTTDVSGGGETVYINNAAYLFYNNARANQASDLLQLLRNVTDTYQMCYSASQIRGNIDLSHGELNSLTNTSSYYQMFFSASGITSVKLSSTSTIPNNFYSMFTNCGELLTVDLSGITAQSTNTATSMFASCRKLTTIKLPANFFADTNGSKYGSCFQNCNALETVNNGTFGNMVEIMPITYIPSNMFYYCQKLNFKTLSDSITYIQTSAFLGCVGLIQFSANNIQYIEGGNFGNAAFRVCSNLKAVWLGSAFVGKSGHQYPFYGTKLTYLYINRPRVDVEQITGYSKGWKNDNPNVTIICNDDSGFMSKADFDAKDWSTYTP